MSKLFKLSLLAAIISLFGLSEALSVSAPSQQARYIGFSNISSTGFDVSVVNGNAAGTTSGRLIILSADGTLDASDTDLEGIDWDDLGTPPDGTNGNREQIGTTNDYVYDLLLNPDTPNNSSSISGLTAGDTWTVFVVEFNQDVDDNYAFNVSTATLNPRTITMPTLVAPDLTNPASDIRATTATLNWTNDGGSTYDQMWLTVLEPSGDRLYDFVDIGVTETFDIEGLTANTVGYEWRITVRDGNVVVASDWATFDTPAASAAPQLDGVTYSSNPVLNGAGQLSIAFEFSEEMDADVTPTVTLDAPSIGTVSNALTFKYSTWTGTGGDSNRIYTVFYDVIDDQTVLDIDVTIAGAVDIDGVAAVNGTENLSQADDLDVDTDLLGVTAIDITGEDVAGQIADSDEDNSGGGPDVIIQVNFDEDTDGTTPPSISFSDETALLTVLTLVSEGYTNIDGTDDGYEFRYTVNAGVDLTLTAVNSSLVDVTVSGAVDAQGNGMDGGSHTENDVFGIDTDNPAVSSITSAEAEPSNSASIVFDVAFSEDVNGVVAGSFTEDVTGDPVTITTPLDVGGSDDAWTVTVNGIDDDGTLSVDLDDATGIDDDYGNALEGTFTAGEEITIDNTLPTVVSIAPTPAMISTVDIGSGNFEIAVEFSEAMDKSITSGILDLTIAENPNSFLNFESGSWNVAGTIYTATYEVVDNTGNDLADIDVRVQSAEDLAGNVMVNDDNTDLFDIDMTLPTVSGISVILGGTIGCGDVGTQNVTFQVTFNEPMNEETESDSNPPILSFDGADGSTAYETDVLSNATYSWNVGGDIVEITYDVATPATLFEDDNYDVTVADAEDANGNPIDATTNSATDVVDFDFTAPSVTSIELYDGNDALVQNRGRTNPTIGQFELDATNSEVYFVITFDDDMDETYNSNPITFTTVNGGALTFDAASSNWTDASEADVYNVYFDVSDSDLEDVDINVDIAGISNTGGCTMNASNNADFFNIDLENPTADAIAFDPDITSSPYLNNYINEDLVGGGVFDVIVTFSETMLNTTAPDLAFDAATITDVTNTLAAAAGSDDWENSDLDYRFNYTTADANVTETGIDIDVTPNTATDLAGNPLVDATGDYDNQFNIDTDAPGYTSVAATDDPIYEGDLVQTITVEYDEEMYASSSPNISFDTGVWTPSAGSWNGPTNTIWTQDFTITDNDDLDLINNVSITGSSGATDIAGNEAADNTNADAFVTDLDQPEVSGTLTVSVDPIVDATVTSPGTFTITIDFDEIMQDDGSANPVIAFPNEDPTNTIAFDSDNWPNNQQYVATYNLTDAGETIDDIDVRVTLAEDVYGNVMIQYNETDVFSIDTENPTYTASVTGTTITDVITDADDGGTVTLQLDFSETMDDGTDNFTADWSPNDNPITGGTLTENTVVGFNGTDDQYTVTYDVADQNAVFTDVDFQLNVTTLTDVNGNEVVNTSAKEDIVDVQMSNPTVTSITLDDYLISNGDAVGPPTPQTLEVVVVFDQSMDDSQTPTVNLIDQHDAIPPTVITLADAPTTGVGGTFSNIQPVGGGWSTTTETNDTYTFTYDITDNGVDYEDIDFQVESTVDNSFGNQLQADQNEDVNLDIKMDNPVIVEITTDAVETDLVGQEEVTANSFDITVQFDEPMNGTVPTLTFPAEDPTAVLTQNGAPTRANDGTYGTDSRWVFNYTVTNVESATGVISDIDIEVAGAEDADGNDMEGQATWTDEFSIDTDDPEVSSISTNLTMINDDDTGGDNFTVTVVFNECMDETGGQEPTIAFNPAVGSTLTALASDTWSNCSTYVATYTVADAGVTETDIDIEVTGGRDVARNPLNVTGAATEANAFDIDTENPTFTIQYYFNQGFSNPLTDYNFAAKQGILSTQPSQYFLQIVSSEALTGNPTVDIEAQGSLNDVTSGATVPTANPNEYRLERNITADQTTDGTVQEDITINATDANGNPATATVGSGITSAADNEPGLDGATPKFTIEYYTDMALTNQVSYPFYVNQGTYYVKLISDELLSADPTVDIEAPGSLNDVTGATLVSLVANREYRIERTFTLDGATDGSVQEDWTIDATDAFNNTSTDCEVTNEGTNAAYIDGTPPTVTLAVDTDPVYEGDVVQVVTATFNEPMAATPDVDLSILNSTNFGTDAGTWTSTTLWTETFTHSGAEETFDPETVKMTAAGGATDRAGNEVAADATETFTLDTKRPTATITISDVTITDADDGSQLTITADFNEVMDNSGSNDPTLAFTNDIVTSGTLMLNAGASGWDGNQSYDFVYDIADVDEEVLDVDIDITGAVDANGNMMNAFNATNQIDVDTENPSVSGALAVSVDPIVDATVTGPGTFTITVNFDEAMDNGGTNDPLFTFPTIGENPFNTITFASGNWPNNQQYVATYNLTDANEEVDDIDVEVAAARDALGNLMATYNKTNVFSIDTENPTLTSVFFTDTQDRADAARLAETVELTFTASEDITAPVVADVQFDGTNADNIATLGGVNQYKADFDIKGGTTEGSLDGNFTIDFADVNGNDGVQVTNTTDNSDIVVDRTLPEISGIAVNSDNTQATITLNDGVYGDQSSTNSTVEFTDFEVTVNGGTATLNGWNIASHSAGSNTVTINITLLGAPDGTEDLRVRFNPNGDTDVFDKAGNGNEDDGAVSGTNPLYSDKLNPVPTATAVDWATATTAGWYGIGDQLDIEVKFNQNVTVTGTPRISLVNLSPTRYAEFVSGSGTNTLTFRYTVLNGDGSTSANGIINNSVIDLNGGTIANGALNASTGLGALEVDNGGADAREVDGTAPTIAIVSPAASQKVSATSEFDVDVTETNMGTTEAQINGAVYATISDPEDFSNIADWAGVADGATFTVNVKHTDAAGNESTVASSDYVKDVTAPTFSSATPDANNTEITVSLSEGVFTNNDGTGDLTLADLDITFNDPDAIVTANINGITHTAGNGSLVLDVNITVGSPSGNETFTIEADNGTAIYDEAGNALATGSPVVATLNPAAPVVDAVDWAAATTTGWYVENDDLDIEVEFSQAVNVTGTPRIELNTTPTRYATFNGGDGTNTLTFRYTVQNNDLGTDVDWSSASIDLNGGTIRNAGSIDALLDMTGKSLANGRDVDAEDPTVSIVSPAALTKVNGADEFDFTASDANPDVNEAKIGAAAFASITDPETFGDIAGWGSVIDGATFTVDFKHTDDAGNESTVSTTFEKDITAPALNTADVASSNDEVTVTFTEPVYANDDATGALQTSDFALTVINGPPSANITGVTHTAGGTTATITFTLTGALDGDEDLSVDFANATSAYDEAGNAAATGSPAVDDFNFGPTVSSIERKTGEANPTNANSVIFTVEFSENVNNVGNGNFGLTTTGTAGGNVQAFGSVSGTTIDVTVENVVGDGTIRLDLTSIGTIDDDDNNLLTSTYNGDEVFTIDNTAPTVTAITRLDDNPTNANSVIFTVEFSENVNNVDDGNFSITATGTAGGNVQTFGPVSGTTIDVTVNSVTGDGTLRLDLSTIAGITDDAGNTLASTFTSGEEYTIDNTQPSVDPQLETLAGNTTVRVIFDEEVDQTTAENTGNYLLSGSFPGWPGAGVTGASLGGAGNTEVVLTVPDYSTIASGETLIVTVSNVEDLAGNTINVANDEATYTETATPTQLEIITTIGTQVTGVPFAVQVQAQTSGGTPVNVTTAVDFTISINTGNGTIANTTGTISIGNNSAIINNFTYTLDAADNGEAGVIITASDDASILSSDNSNAFDVVPVEPSTQATSINFSNIGNNFVSFQWSSGGGEGAIVGMSNSSPVDNPQNGENYGISNVYGAGGSDEGDTYFVYQGIDNSVTVTGLSNLTTYYVKVFEYNGDIGVQNFNVNNVTGNPGNFTTPLFKESQLDRTYKLENLFVTNLYPNPAVDQIKVDMSLSTAKSITMKIFNSEGSLIYVPVSNLQYNRGEHTIELDLDQLNLASGIYQLAISSGDEATILPFTIVK